MDVLTILISVLSSLGISAATAWSLSDKLVVYRLRRHIEKYKTELQKELEKEKTLWQAEVRKESEVYIGEKAAEREYKYEARKRLYHATGALRLQLLVACQSAALRFKSHCSKESFQINLERYYGRSTLYRLLRPIAIAELIERQMAYADFQLILRQ